MTRQELYQQLRAFDWYYDYSDDGDVWRRGHARKQELEAELHRQECSFAWWDIFRAINGFIRERAIEIEPGKFKFPKWSEHVAPVRERDLISQAKYDEIQAWFDG